MPWFVHVNSRIHLKVAFNCLTRVYKCEGVQLWMLVKEPDRICVSTLEDLKIKGRLSINVHGHDLVIFYHNNQVYALDNRCPHMGFPLSRGSTKDGILTCDWHHARFDLKSGGTFDLWAGDVAAFPVQVHDDKVWVTIEQHTDLRAQYTQLLHEGLKQNNGLLIAKSVIALLTSEVDTSELVRIGVKHGTNYRQDGWGQGLTTLVCMSNLLPFLSLEDKSRALYHGLSAVAQDCDGAPPRFIGDGLPGTAPDIGTLKQWFRNFIEVRDSDAAERCLISAIQSKMDISQIADMMFCAATDHRYLDGGHVLDFTNKAFEALEQIGWDVAEEVLTSLVPLYARATRMEERSSWRHPIDLAKILERTFKELSDCLEAGKEKRGNWKPRISLIDTLLGDNPDQTADVLLNAIREGATEEELAAFVEYTSALRIAHFAITNEFSDWDIALHTYAFSHAVSQSIRRFPSAELMRAIFDAAMSIYLNRFLNVPRSPLPKLMSNVAAKQIVDHGIVSKKFLELLDKRDSVNDVVETLVEYASLQLDQDRLLSLLGNALLREDRNFHSIQMIEAAIRQCQTLVELEKSLFDRLPVLIAAVRYLAAHSPTVRRQGQMFEIAWRLQRGEKIYEGIE